MTPENVMDDEVQDTPFGLASLPADRLLVLAGALCAIGFGALALVLYIRGETYPLEGYSTLGGAIFGFAIALAFGLGLLLAFSKMTKRTAEGAILALAFSVVLLAFGALPGLISGIVGLIGALTSLVRNLRFST